MKQSPVQQKFNDVERNLRKAFGSVKRDIDSVRKLVPEVELLKKNVQVLDNKKFNSAEFEEHEKQMRASFKSAESDISKMDKLRKDVEKRMLSIEAEQKKLDNYLAQAVKEIKHLNSKLMYEEDFRKAVKDVKIKKSKLKKVDENEQGIIELEKSSVKKGDYEKGEKKTAAEIEVLKQDIDGLCKKAKGLESMHENLLKRLEKEAEAREKLEKRMKKRGIFGRAGEGFVDFFTEEFDEPKKRKK